MAGTIDPGDAIAAMETIITADLPAILDTIDTEASATGAEVLDDIAGIFLAPQDKLAAGDLPALTIVCVGTDYMEEYGLESGVYQHEVAMEVVLRGNDRTASYAPDELLTVKLQRTVRGLVTAIHAKPKLTVSGVDAAAAARFSGVAYSELDASGNALEKRAELSFFVTVSTS